MTSRLKHKLELENINLKSAYLNESFVQVSDLPRHASPRLLTPSSSSCRYRAGQANQLDRDTAAGSRGDKEGQAGVCPGVATGGMYDLSISTGAECGVY
jgi:hypothetical protein